ncbi:MAG: rod shape-determining protein MreC, partial [bacterium]
MSGRPKPSRRWWSLLAAAAVVLASWWGFGLFSRARRMAARPLRSLAAPLALAARSATEAPESPADRLRRQVLLLKIENASLRERLDREAARDGEPHLVFPDQRLAKLLPCALLFRDPAVWFKDFSVDVGSDQDVHSGAGVLNVDGVVGRLATVGRFGSRVLLLSAPNCHFSARLARTGLQCVVSGDGQDGCLLEHLGGQDDVRVGDLVET